MNLLIVDDEEITREGILSSIDWISLGIHNIYQADDGIRGLALAKKYRPEIILSDVRMPRMDGIEMAYKIRELYPGSNIIFMSGYSDKEYLKAAIKLKAISYVEKPIVPAEIQSAIAEAISMNKVLELSKHSIDIHVQESVSKLALQIIYPVNAEYDSILSQFSALNYTIKSNTTFTTIIIRFVEGVSSIGNRPLNDFYGYFKDLLKSHRLQSVFGMKQDEYMICHIFSNEKYSSALIRKIGEAVVSFLSASCHVYIGIGKTVSGLHKVYDSYNSAVVLLQSSFFYKYNSILVETDPASLANEKDTPYVSFEICNKFSEALSSHERETCLSLADSLYQRLQNNRRVLVNYSKELYYKLFSILYDTAASAYINIPTDDDSITLLDYVSKSNTLMELHTLLTDKINLFFENLKERIPENSTTFLIKEFISKNYKNESLSIKDISEHVFLSSSYVCTVFKNETGQTLNQYLTEYRMEKAKKLLQHPHYKITDISSKVGYSDGNYFSKTFKKFTGLSPSEFRELNSK